MYDDLKYCRTTHLGVSLLVLRIPNFQIQVVTQHIVTHVESLKEESGIACGRKY